MTTICLSLARATGESRLPNRWASLAMQVPPVFEIKRDYVDATAPVVRQQLAKAVLRLAYVLNDTLGD